MVALAAQFESMPQSLHRKGNVWSPLNGGDAQLWALPLSVQQGLVCVWAT